MSYTQEKQDIEDFFRANWSHTPIAFENGEMDSDGEWVRLTIVNGDAFQASMGDNPAFRYPGVVYVHIRTRKDIGSGRAIQLADYVDNLFKNLVLTNLRFKVPQIRRNPSTNEWFQIVVSTEFYRGS